MRNTIRSNRQAFSRSRAVRLGLPIIALVMLAQTAFAMAQKPDPDEPSGPVPAPIPEQKPIEFPTPPAATTPPPAGANPSEPAATPPPSTETSPIPVTPPPPLPPLPEMPSERPKILYGKPPVPRRPVKPAAEGDVPPPNPNDPGRESPSKFINVQRDTTGLLPAMPPGPAAPPDADAVNKKLNDLIGVIDPEAEINLVMGQSKVIETLGQKWFRRIAVANPMIADIEFMTDQPGARLMTLTGKRFGTTSITFWEADEDEKAPPPENPVLGKRPVSILIRVSLDCLDFEKRINQTFPGAAVKVRQVGQQVILEGQVPDSKTMSEVLTLVNAELRNNQSTGMGAAGGGMAGGGMAGGGATGGGTAGGGYGGSVGGIGGGGMAGGTTGGMYPIINRVRVPGARQIMLHVKIAELNRTAIRQLGVSWLDPKNQAILGSTIGGAAGISGTLSPTQIASTNARGQLSKVASTFSSSGFGSNGTNAQLFGIFNAGQFSIFLNALRSNSMAKLLAEPSVMTLDGQPAQFVAGGQYPYPVAQSSSNAGGGPAISISYKTYGAILNFLPNILQNDEIQLDVAPQFSQLDYGAGTTLPGAGTVPGLDIRSARTVVRLREGQTLAIAGLLQSKTNGTTVRVPVLGDLPLVGGLFSSNQHQVVETELVVLVTPELVSPMEASEVPPSPGDTVYNPNDYEFYFLGRIEGKLGREFRATVAEHDPLNVMKHFQSENRWVIGPHGHSD